MRRGSRLSRSVQPRGETSTQYDAMILLQKIYIRLPEPVNAAILADRGSYSRLVVAEAEKMATKLYIHDITYVMKPGPSAT